MVYMLLGTGFEETEAVTPIDLLRRAGVSVATVGIGGKVVTGTSAGCAVPFGLALIAALKGQAAAQAVAEQIVIR